MKIQDIFEKLGLAVEDQITADAIGMYHRVPVANSTVNKNAIVQFGKTRNAVLEKSREIWQKILDSKTPFTFVCERPDMPRSDMTTRPCGFLEKGVRLKISLSQK